MGGDLCVLAHRREPDRPRRMKRSRRRGARLPDGAIYVVRPTRWGNPWVVHAEEIVLHRDSAEEWWTPGGARRTEVVLFAQDLRGGLLGLEPTRLTGRDLACWCSLPAEGRPDWCHGAILLAWANPESVWPASVSAVMAELAECTGGQRS